LSDLVWLAHTSSILLLPDGNFNLGVNMTIAKEIYSSPSLKDDVKMASESAAEEAELKILWNLKKTLP